MTKASCRAPGSDVPSALCAACQQGDLDSVRRILGTALVQREAAAATAAGTFAENACIDLDVRVCVNVAWAAAGRVRTTALVEAVMGGHVGVVKALVASGLFNANRAATDCLAHRAHGGSEASFMAGMLPFIRVDMAQQRLARDALSGMYPLIGAVRHGHAGVVAALARSEGIWLDVSEDVSRPWHTPLCLACKDGHAGIASLLITAGADVDALTSSMRFSVLGADMQTLLLTSTGMQFWQRRRHDQYGWGLARAVHLLLCVRQRHNTTRAPDLPVELWLEICKFFRSRDFLNK